MSEYPWIADIAYPRVLTFCFRRKPTKNTKIEFCLTRPTNESAKQPGQGFVLHEGSPFNGGLVNIRRNPLYTRKGKK